MTDPHHCQVKIVIYGGHQHPNEFIDTAYVEVSHMSGLREFIDLSSRKWKYKTVKNQYPLSISAWNSRNYNKIMVELKNSDFIKAFVNCIVPRDAGNFIQNEPKRKELKIIGLVLKQKLRERATEFMKYFYPVADTVMLGPKVAALGSMIRKGNPLPPCPFNFVDAIREDVIKLIGFDIYVQMDLYISIIIWHGVMRHLRRVKAFERFLENMKSKCCDQCGRMEKRGIRFEKFKKCKCRQRRYCNRTCQKINWIQHRLTCSFVIRE